MYPLESLVDFAAVPADIFLNSGDAIDPFLMLVMLESKIAE
jgi:hypothetical protein